MLVLQSLRTAFVIGLLRLATLCPETPSVLHPDLPVLLWPAPSQSLGPGLLGVYSSLSPLGLHWAGSRALTTGFLCHLCAEALESSLYLNVFLGISLQSGSLLFIS